MKPRSDAQAMSHIDVRSEQQFRRSIEAVGNYETIGFARVTLDETELDDEVKQGLAFDQQVSMPETALRSIGLTENFAR